MGRWRCCVHSSLATYPCHIETDALLSFAFHAHKVVAVSMAVVSQDFASTLVLLFLAALPGRFLV